VPKYVSNQFSNLNANIQPGLNTFASFDSSDGVFKNSTSPKGRKVENSHDNFLIEINSPPKDENYQKKVGKKQLLRSFHSMKPDKNGKKAKNGSFKLGVTNNFQKADHQRSLDTYPENNGKLGAGMEFTTFSNFSSNNTRPKSRDNYSAFNSNFLNHGHGLSRLLSSKMETGSFKTSNASPGSKKI
jgi:hypothetical protein